MNFNVTSKHCSVKWQLLTSVPTCKILFNSLISADQQAPPLNRKIFFSSLMCMRKVCVTSKDPAQTVLFEFAQLK